MISPDTANRPIEHDTLKLNGNGNSNKATTPLTTDGLAEPKGNVEKGGEDVVKDEGGEEEEGETEEEEADDEEPSLKYERITGAVPDVLEKDSASALAVSNKLLVISSIIIFFIATLNDLFLLQALGTHAGMIHILDIT